MATPLDDLEAWLGILQSQRYVSEHTLAAYRRDLSKLANFLVSQGCEEWAEVDQDRLTAFIGPLLSTNSLLPTSIQRMLSAMRGFYDWLGQQGKVSYNPARAFKIKRQTRELPHVMDVDVVNALLDAPPPEGEHAIKLWIRDKAVMELFYSSGLRVSELSNTHLTDIDLNGGLITVTGKGRKTRVLPIGRKASLAIREWLRIRSDFIKADSSDWIFLSERGGRFTERAIQYALEAQARRIGIAQHLHPHLLRHCFASHLLESSQDLRACKNYSVMPASALLKFIPIWTTNI